MEYEIIKENLTLENLEEAVNIIKDIAELRNYEFEKLMPYLFPFCKKPLKNIIKEIYNTDDKVVNNHIEIDDYLADLEMIFLKEKK